MRCSPQPPCRVQDEGPRAKGQGEGGKGGGDRKPYAHEHTSRRGEGRGDLRTWSIGRGRERRGGKDAAPAEGPTRHMRK